MDLWSQRTLKPLLVPGGALLAVAAILLQSGLVAPPASAIDSFYYLVFTSGLLLAWRFHSSRVLFALLVLLMAHRALEFFSAGGASPAVAGRNAFRAVALLLPLTFVVFSLMPERGFAIPAIASRLSILFVEAVFVAVICRPGQGVSLSFLDAGLTGQRLWGWSRVPAIAWLACIFALAFLLTRFVVFNKPVESGLLWSLLAAFLGLQAGGTGRTGSAYFATAGLILAGCIIESSYLLAYHDELTSLPARRAFNDTVLRLEPPYAVAMVDIDHFKMFNDTYGHDAGDHVLRMVASKIARVGGGGRAFRIGGEEFCIVFSQTAMKDALPHLEWLRTEIATSSFRLRTPDDRRRAPKSTDRRRTVRRKTIRGRNGLAESSAGEVLVTVSIGAAEPTARMREAEKVIRAADQALYRAKQNGRNRVETATTAAPSRLKRNIA